MNNFETTLESEVRYYCRLFPTTFCKAKGSYMFDENGKKYIDFFCGSGSLNYGHNNPYIQQTIINYLINDGIINSLDQMTVTKRSFMNRFNDIILKPRNYKYKMQFCGPTGTNSVEASIKLARKFTKREKIIYFQHSFHGMTYGAMSVSGSMNNSLNSFYKQCSIEMPFSDNENSLSTLQNYLDNCDPRDIPAGIILETIQAEGGIKVASQQWLEEVAAFAKNNGILLIIDDIQTGCGRTGHFFSFETYNLNPDIICLSKSLSGYGFPLSMNLIRPEIDCWEPGEHTGTFRGNNLAFLAGNSVLNYWETDDLSSKIIASSRVIEEYFQADDQLKKFNLRGRGLMRGIQLKNSEEAAILQQILFKNGILMDICGYNEDIIKIMPPINISQEDLLLGLEIINKSIFEYETNN